MTTVPATIQEGINLPTARGDGGGGTTLTVSDVTAILKHRMVMIIITWLLFTVIGLGAFFLVYFKFPTYTAECLIECISDAPSQTGELGGDMGMTKDRYERFVATQVALATSPTVLEEVLKRPEVKNSLWYREADQTKLRLELEDDLHAVAAKDSNYFRIFMGCRSIDDPANIVNQVKNIYMERVRNRAADSYREELDVYEREQSALEAQINDKLRVIQDFTSTLEPGEQQDKGVYGPMVTEIMDRQREVSQLELQVLELESFSNIYNDPNGPGVTVEDQREVEGDARVISLDNQVNFFEQQLEIALNDLGPEHRETKATRRQLDVARKQTAEARENRLREVVEFKQEQVHTAFLNAQHQLLLAQEKLTDARTKQTDVERKLAALETLEDELEMLKQTRERADEYIREVRRVVREQTAVRIKVLQSAVKPLQRSSPSLLLLPAVCMLAVGLAVAMAVAIELLDTSVRTPQDMIRHLNLPLLGTVPDIDDEEVDIEQIETAVRSTPHSMMAESFRTIRTNLQFSAPPDRQRTLLITSPRPEDGKTTIACNLAETIALTGRRVLLVDANLRRPALHRIFPGIGKVGLSNYLIGDAGLDEMIHKTDVSNLDVIGSGPQPPNPAELLNGALAGEFLDAVIGRYDQIIIDTPPVLLATDTSVLATRIDGVVLVCRAKDDSRGQALRAISLLDRVSAPIFGGILNCAQVRRGGYFREQLRTFYEYQDEEDQADRDRALPASEPEETASSTTQDDPDAGEADSGAKA